MGDISNTQFFKAVQEEQKLEREREKLIIVAGKEYPVIYSVNLKKNTYVKLNREASQAVLPPPTGNFDDLPLKASETVHPDYRERYLEMFSRQNLLACYGIGIPAALSGWKL